MKLSRIGAAALCAALCLGTMSGCSSKTDGANEGGSQTAESQTTAGQTAAGKTEAGGAAGSDEKFTLKISTTGETDDNLDLAMAMFKEQYPNVEYELITSPWNETREKQIMMVSMGDIPDIVKTGGWAQEFFKDGMLMDLTDEVKNWDIYPRLTEGQLQRMSYGDQICAMNYNTNTMFMFYNKELLEKIGAEVPKTFEDLKAIGEKIVAEGITTEDGQKVYATNIPTNNTWELSPWVFSMGAEYMNEDYSQVVIDSPESIEAHTQMQDFVKNGWAPIPDGTGDQLWLNGQMVTYFTGEWNIPGTVDAGIDVAYATIPTGKDGLSVGPIGGCDWAVMEESENKAMAMEFLKLMYSEEFQIQADRGVTDLAIYDNPKKQAVWAESGLTESKKVQQEQLKTAKFVFLDNPYQYPEGANIYGAAVERILIKQEDVKTVLEEAAAQINKGMAQ